MNLVEIYKKRNRDHDWFFDHSSLARGRGGRMFEYTNTNFRKQDAFISQFKSFLEVENVPRSKWPRQVNHGQEIHKHMVVNMIQSKLFKKDIHELYSRTAKGNLYNSFIDSNLPEDERWLINYLFLLNGYYFNRKNYIVHRVKDDLLGYLLSIDGLTEDILIDSAKKLIDITDANFSQILRNDFFYIHSFYNDSDLLISYLRASNTEKEELAKYIEDNRTSGNFQCCLSEKYRPGRNFTFPMLFDETKVFLLTLLFIKTEGINHNNVYQTFIDNYDQNIIQIDVKLVFTYLIKNKNIFDPILIEVLEIEEVEIVDIKPELTLEIEKDQPEKYIDETDEEGKQKIKQIYSIRKKQARIQGRFLCALEKINNCQPIYFTAKANRKNYTEVHHLIPREFRNDFPHSIEVLANYITLCPRCHRQIHLAMDRERKALINALYEQRKDRLDDVGLKLDLEKMHEYYKIDS